MSPYIKDAVIAIEDSRFYEHGGVDTTGIMRALVSTARGNKQGASTITQQYVNNVINSSLEAEGKGDQVLLNGVNKGVGDKLREMKLAIALEKKFTKEQILEGYLNIVFFNRDAYGIEAASKFFFSTTAKDLTLPQAALLAGLVNSPSFFDPITNPENAKDRRDLVLKSMLHPGQDQAGRLRRRRRHPGGNQGHPGAPGLRLLADGPVLLRLRAAPAAEQPGLRRRRRRTRAEGLPRRPDHQDHPGPERPEAVAQAQVEGSAGANPDKWGASLVSVQPGTGKIIYMAQNTRGSWRPRASSTTSVNFNVDMHDAKGNDLNGLGGFQPGSTMKPFTFAAVAQRGQVHEHRRQRLRAPVPAELPVAEHLPHHRSTAPTTRRKKRLGAADDLQNAEEGYYKNMTRRSTAWRTPSTP